MIIKVNLVIANAYIVRGRKTVVVDTGAPGSDGRILKALKKHRIPASQFSLILLTHAHSDHAGSARALRDRFHVPVAVHRADAAMLKRGDNGSLLTLGWEAGVSKPFVDRPFPGIDADILLDAAADLHDFGLDARLLHTPGHSEGSISLIFENGDAIVGDILRGGIMGGTFLAQQPNYPYFLYNISDKAVLHNSIQRVLDAGARQLYTGHGGPLPRAAVERWLTMRHQPILVG
jgi:hydroxyacylglutathione hydrolase